MKFRDRIAAIVFVGLSAAWPRWSAQDYPPAFPRPNATKLVETDRITVWDIVWPTGQPSPLHRHVYDQVGTYYQAGGRVITSLDGTKRSAMTAVGALSTTRRGTTHIEEGATDPPLRAVFIELKRDGASGLSVAPGDVPRAFPREGAKALLDDERVTVWDSSWTAGARETMSMIERDTIWVWLAAGTISCHAGGRRHRDGPGQGRRDSVPVSRDRRDHRGHRRTSAGDDLLVQVGDPGPA